MSYNKKCIICDTYFEARVEHSTVCSDKCRKENRKENRDIYLDRFRTKERFDEKCLNCKKDVSNRTDKKIRYCSDECKNTNLRNLRKKRSDVELLKVKKCEFCNEEFNSKYSNRRFCSEKCGRALSKNEDVKLICKECCEEYTVSYYMRELSKFCSRSCSAKYNSTHKTKGTQRSKLEIWLESQLIELYPNLEIHFNRKDTINSELDFYIPSLKLAFELNGILHYEPIYGPEKLLYIQNNDNRKFQACLERQIELCIIDSSKHKYFKESTCKPYLNLIIEIIEQKKERDIMNFPF